MVTRRTKEPELHDANLSLEQMQAALPQLQRRIDELKTFDVNTMADRSDPRVDTLESKLDHTLLSVFGFGTVEYQRYRRAIGTLDRASFNMYGPTPIHEVREGVKLGVDTAISQLEGLQGIFKEHLEDGGLSTTGRSLKAYEGMELHQAIERAAGKLFRDGHYANAVEDSVKALNSLVKLNSGVDDKDGTALMEFVFSPKNPVLKFNELKDDSDRDEQKGFMMLFSGAVAGLRNPRAHKIIDDDPEKALEFIAFVSLLAKLADKAAKA